MNPKAALMQDIEDRFTRWASESSEIRALMVVGSRGAKAGVADEWSDLDLIVVAKDPAKLLTSSDWLKAMGRPILSCIEPMRPKGRVVWRVIFEGGADVDVSAVSAREFGVVLAYLTLETRRPWLKPVVPRAIATRLELAGRTLLDYTERGRRFLVDKGGYEKPLEFAARRLGMPRRQPPSAEQFERTVCGFWQHSLRAAKRLARGEVYLAKECIDLTLKQSLMTVVQWHVGATRGWDQAPNSWTRSPFEVYQPGRTFEQWADPRVLASLRRAFGHYDRIDLCKALIATSDLFSILARETAEALRHPYPEEGERFAIATSRAVCDAIIGGEGDQPSRQRSVSDARALTTVNDRRNEYGPGE